MKYLPVLTIPLVLWAAACDVISGGEPTRIDAGGSIPGESVAIDGGTVIIGAPGSNEAFVFEDRGDGYDRVASLSPSASQTALTAFGQEVDVAGDIAVVGAPDYVIPLPPRPGQVYVYERSGDRWTEAAVLQSTAAQDQDAFGRIINFSRAVTDGRTVAVLGGGCTPSPDGQVTQKCGVVEVFERGSGGWTRTAEIANPAPEIVNRFGVPLDIDGDRIAAVARDDFDNPNRVYTFRRTGDAWDVEGYLEMPPSEGLGGGALALDGDVIAVSDVTERPNGATYVYHWTGAGWDLAARLAEPDLGGLASYGNDLDLSGDRLIVGARGRRIDGQTRGAAFVYHRDASGGWELEAELRSPDGQRGLGLSVGISGSRAIVGWNNTESRGGAYVFTLRDGAWEAGL